MRRDGGSVFPARANTGDPKWPVRGLSGNEIERELRSMMAGSTSALQSEAGYIDARPQIRQIDENLLRRTAGPYIGSFASFGRCLRYVRLAGNSGNTGSC